jgi:hypothetical protein
MKIRSVLWVVSNVALFLVGGCATPSRGLSNYSGDDAGSMLLSLSQPSGNVGIPGVFVRRVGTWDHLELSHPLLGTGGIGPDFNSTEGIGVVITSKLPQGEYEIYRYQLGSDVEFLRSANDFPSPLRFSVKTGEVAYLGNFSIWLASSSPNTPVKQEGQVTIVPIARFGARIRSSDAQKRDMGIATARDPQLAYMKLKSYVPVTTLEN